MLNVIIFKYLYLWMLSIQIFNKSGALPPVYELFKRPSYLIRHPKKSSFKMTVTQTLTTVRGMKIAPLLHHPTITTWHNSHRLPLHNGGTLPPVHKLF
jgi:hypothetical protein